MDQHHDCEGPARAEDPDVKMEPLGRDAAAPGSSTTGHLIHVGFPKTGSNFLRRWFREHPQLAYIDGGIAGYQDVYDVVRQAATQPADVRYRVTSCESFTAPQPDTGRRHQRPEYQPDPAPGQENACAALASLFPNARVLIVTRGFRAMIYSSFSQGVRAGADMSLEECLSHPQIDGAWDYDRVIGMYRRAFGAEQVLIMPYELLCDDAEGFVGVLEDGLGLTHLAPARDRLNAALSPVELYWYPRITRIVRRLPIGGRLKRLYLRGLFGNRFWPVIALLQRLRPGAPVIADVVPESLIARYRAKSLTLRDNPLFAAYAREYYEP